MTFIRDALRGERRCVVGTGPDGEAIYAMYVRANWADAEIAFLRDALERESERDTGRWISVSDRMPRDGVTVAVLRASGDPDYDVHEDGAWLAYENMLEEFEAVRIPEMTCDTRPYTHWMPLPMNPLLQQDSCSTTTTKG